VGKINFVTLKSSVFSFTSLLARVLQYIQLNLYAYSHYTIFVYVGACVCRQVLQEGGNYSRGEKENQQTVLRWQTTRSLNPSNKLHSVNGTILETAMTRQESFSGGAKMQLCKKCRQLYRQPTHLFVFLWSFEARNV